MTYLSKFPDGPTAQTPRADGATPIRPQQTRATGDRSHSAAWVYHRIPFLVVGNAAGMDKDPSQFMLLCAPHNRSKSWTCEHCANGIRDKEISVCATCYWASPENYVHVALRPERRVDLTWQEGEVRSYDRLKRTAQKNNRTLQDYLKELLRDLFKGRK